jgi:hypothetical protein
MVDIDEILAAAIRNALQQFNGPAPRLPYQIEAETVRRIRAALESEGINVSPSQPSTQAPALAPVA